MPRMKILNSIELENFESPPQFSSVQRKSNFDFPNSVLREAKSRRTADNQILFLVSYGYFKATKQFYDPETFHRQDLEYVARNLNLRDHDVSVDAYSKAARRGHQKKILMHFGFRLFNGRTKNVVLKKIDAMVATLLTPKLILLRLIEALIKNRIAVPSYFALSDIILAATNKRKHALGAIVKRTLTKDGQKILDALLSKDTPLPPKTKPGLTAAYKLTLLKRPSQSMRPTKIKERVHDLMVLRGLYLKLLPVLDALDLSHEGIRYYAHGVIKTQTAQLIRRPDDDRYLHMVAFIAHQYCRLQDNLVDVLISSLQSCIGSARRVHKEKFYGQRREKSKTVSKLIDSLDGGFMAVLNSIRSITINENLSDTHRIELIKELLSEAEPKAKEIENNLTPLKEELQNELNNGEYLEILESNSLKIQNRVSPILKTISFKKDGASKELLEAIEHFKAKAGAVDKSAPVEFLKPSELVQVSSGKKFRVSLYKALLFVHVMDAIKSGNLNLENSYKYRALDDYLIDRDRWSLDKSTLLERAGLDAFTDAETTLNHLDDVPWGQFTTTNKNIIENTNAFAKTGKDGLIRVSTPKQEPNQAAPLQTFFPENRYVPLLEVLSTVERCTGYLGELQHWKKRYRRKKPPRRNFYAGIIGLGCNIGTRKIARISTQISEATLENTINWFFSLDNIHAANDKVLRLMDRLELPHIYRKSNDALHTASDGQKFEVRGDSLNSHHSFKYFGKEKGVSVYTFLDERNLFFYSTVISAAERESAYVIDGLMHNNVVKSDIHSTDTHGYSELIFGVMHLLGFSYAPRIKNIKRQRLYIFKSRKGFNNEEVHISPAGYINREIIEENWDDILRFIATIKLKEATASDIFRRLNSYSKQHELYRALKAFGQVIKSIFIFRYIDDVEYRQSIQKQLNNVESSHQFARAISVGSPREFTQAEKEDQEIAESCKRLIKNAITCWNYLYLTQKISDTVDAEDRQALVDAIANDSVVSWRHINLLGEYDFSAEKQRDSVGIRLPNLAA